MRRAEAPLRPRVRGARARERGSQSKLPVLPSGRSGAEASSLTGIERHFSLKIVRKFKIFLTVSYP